MCAIFQMLAPVWMLGEQGKGKVKSYCLVGGKVWKQRNYLTKIMSVLVEGRWEGKEIKKK